ncbi:MAG: hypothetical protein WD468_02195, partial [Pirellulales bacterium]
MPMLVNELIWSGGVPLVAAAIAVAVSARFGVRPRAAWALGVGLGFVVASAALTTRTVGMSAAVAKHAQPIEAHDWLPLAVLAAMGVTLLASATPREWQRWIVGLAGLMCVAVPMRLLAGNIAIQWSALEKLTHLALFAAALALLWLQLSTARDDQQPRLRAMLLVIVAAAMAAVLTKSGSLSSSKLGLWIPRGARWC